jgi:cleavage and polyadenylation specificity factor subunit 1
VTFLGYKVSAEGSRPLEERIMHLQACPPPKTDKLLRQFLGMLNSCTRFLPNAADIQAPLHDILSGPRVKGSYPITWTPELQKAFEECKASLSRATLLAHPNPSARLALVTDASTSAMGAVLQQRVQRAWQALAFFSKKISPAQQKYSAYDRELLAIYEALKHFRHMLEARHFIIFTDHNPITYAFQKKGQVFATAVQPPRLHIAIHDRYTPHLRSGQRRHRRAFPRRVRHLASNPRRTGRSTKQRRRTSNTPGKAGCIASRDI